MFRKMVSRSERIILAGVMSLTCFCISFYWYKYGQGHTQRRNKAEAIAVLESSSSQVQRKPAKRVIWQEISPGAMLYSKESIRTASDSSAEITFLDNQSKIEVDPDSVIVLEKSDGGIALNFLKGNVFVAGSEGSILKIKSGDSVVDAGNGSLNLSRQNGESLELQVLDGSATISANGKSTSLAKNQMGTLSEKGLSVEKDLIEVLSPTAGRKVYINYAKKEKFKILWKKLAKDYKVVLYAGRSSKKLKRSRSFRLSKSVEKPKDKLQVKFKPGDIYWQLRATSNKADAKDLKSPVFKSRVVSVKEPAFVEPREGQAIYLQKGLSQFEFRWTDPMGMKGAKLQLWRKNKKGNIIKGSEALYDVENKRFVHTFSHKGEKKAEYEARLTGFLETEDKTIPVSSSIVSFTVLISDEMQAPVLISPLANQRMRYERIRDTGLSLSWEEVNGATKYFVKLKKPGAKKWQETEVSKNSYELKNIAAGEYEWLVYAKDKEVKKSPESEIRAFLVTDIPILAWGEDSQEGISYYVGETPQLNLDWQGDYPEAVQYKVVFSQQSQWDKAKSSEVKRNSFSNNVTSDGFYEAQVQALNAKQKVLAQTHRKTLQVKLLPHLPAPEFDPSLDNKLKADRRGNIRLFWEPVNSAKKYLLRLTAKNKSDKPLEFFSDGSEASKTLKGLKPGLYTTELYSVDRFERLSLDKDKRSIRVENRSDIRAPSGIKGIKVKGVYRSKK